MPMACRSGSKGHTFPCHLNAMVGLQRMYSNVGISHVFRLLIMILLVCFDTVQQFALSWYRQMRLSLGASSPV